MTLGRKREKKEGRKERREEGRKKEKWGKIAERAQAEKEKEKRQEKGMEGKNTRQRVRERLLASCPAHGCHSKEDGASPVTSEPEVHSLTQPIGIP